MRPSLRRAASLAVRSSEWLVLLLLLAASIPPVLLRHQSLTPISKLNLLDGSWVLDTSYKAAGGIWFGRDVAFTYGPLFQWLSSAPSRWIGISTGTIYATWHTLPLLLIVVFTFLTARLLLPQIAVWRRALLVLLAVVFWSPPDLRVSLCLLSFAVFVRVTDAVALDKHLTLGALTAAAICVAAFWLSADTGLYTTAALLLCIAATAIAKRRIARMARFFLIAVAFFAFLVLLTNAALFSLLDFRFWRSSFAIVGGYRWFEPSAMAKPDKRLWFETLGLGLSIFGAAWWWREPGRTWTRRPVFLVSGFCVAFVVLQSTLVRSDHGHLVAGTYAMLFLCGAIALDEFDLRLLSIVLPAVAVIATLALASAYPLYQPANALRRFHWVVHPLLTCHAGTREFDRACFPSIAAELLSTVSADVDSRTQPSNRIAVFPYETVFGFASRRQVAGGVLQSYLVNGEYLTDLELAGLRRSSPPFALYFPDEAISEAIDSVPNFTRSPELWFYLVQHYRAAGSPAPGVVGLIRDDSRAARLSFVERQIAGSVGPVPIRKRSSSIELALQEWPPAGADFVKARLRVIYPAWWRIRKPSKLAFQFWFADGTEKTIQFVLQPNHASDIWIYPWDPREMGNYFSEDEAQWQRQSRPALARLKLLVNPYDWISVIPGSISIENISAVKLQTN